MGAEARRKGAPGQGTPSGELGGGVRMDIGSHGSPHPDTPARTRGIWARSSRRTTWLPLEPSHPEKGNHLWSPQEPVSRHQRHAKAPAQQEEGSRGHWSVSRTRDPSPRYRGRGWSSWDLRERSAGCRGSVCSLPAFPHQGVSDMEPLGPSRGSGQTLCPWKNVYSTLSLQLPLQVPSVCSEVGNPPWGW